MGSLQASEMVRLLGTRTDTALSWHLQSNHYPPVPLTMLQPNARSWKGETAKRIKAELKAMTKGK